MQGVHLRKYGVETTIDFELYEVDGVNLRTDWVPAAADCEVMKDGGASTQCTNTATDEGSTYSIVLTATEMEAARLVLKVVDAATKVFLDKVIIIETYGHASAMHAFDLDTASSAQTGDSYPIVSSGTHGNAALKTLVDSVLAYSASAAAWGSINSGTIFRGKVTAADPGVSFTIGGLAGQGAGAFIDANTPWYAYVFRDAGGAGAAPQGEVRKVTAYTSATGLFTTDAFTADVAVDDDVMIVSAALINSLAIKTRVELALPNAAADAAGGLPISDAGGLDLDTKLADTNEVTAARMGALTDWIDDGRLDALLDAIKAKTDNLPADPASETNVDANETKIDTVDAVVDAIKAVTDALPNAGALNDLATLEGRLSAARSGYLDNLSAGAVALAAKLEAFVQLLARKDAAIATDRAVELAEINADEGSGGGTFSNQTDSEEALRDRGDTAWAGTGDLLIHTTIATLTDQTHFTLTAGSGDDGAYEDQTAMITDQTTGEQKSVRTGKTYTGGTKALVLGSAPDFTIAVGDIVDIFATAPGTTAPTAAEVADAVHDEMRADHTASGSFGEALQDGYWADIDYRRADDETPAKDRYEVRWYFGLQRQTSGITTPKITVRDHGGNALVNDQAMSDVGSGQLLYTAQGAERQGLGTQYEVTTTATIDGAVRTWSKNLGRDS